MLLRKYVVFSLFLVFFLINQNFMMKMDLFISEGTKEEEIREIRLLVGHENSLHLFYQQSFISLDVLFTDWVVLSSIDFNFKKPIRVGGELHFAHEDTAKLLTPFSFNDSEVVVYYTETGSSDTWGFYQREWNRKKGEWESNQPLFTGEDLGRIFELQNISGVTHYYGKYLPAAIQNHQLMYLVVQLDLSNGTTHLPRSNPWLLLISLKDNLPIFKKEIPLSTKIPNTYRINLDENLIKVGNSTNIIVQLESDDQIFFIHFNGSEFSSNHSLPSNTNHWRISANNTVVLGAYDSSKGSFTKYVFENNELKEKKINLTLDWEKILDWELDRNNNVHTIVETSDGLEYAVLSDVSLQIRELNKLKFKKLIDPHENTRYLLDLSLHLNNSVYLCGLGENDNLGIVKLSLDEPLRWFNASGWDSLTKCGYSDCFRIRFSAFFLGDIVISFIILIGISRKLRKII